MSSLVVRTQSLHLPYQWPMQTCLSVTCCRFSQQAPPISYTMQLRFEGPGSSALTYPVLSLYFLPVNDIKVQQPSGYFIAPVPYYSILQYTSLHQCCILQYTTVYFIAPVLYTTVYYSILQYTIVYLVCCLHLQFLQLVLESVQLFLLRVIRKNLCSQNFLLYGNLICCCRVCCST